MLVSKFFFMIFVVAALMATAVSESNSNKPIRSQQRQMKLASPSGIGARGMSSSDRSSSANSNENRNSVKDRSAPLFSLRVAVTEVKDEVTDIFESIVFADNNSERLENAFDAIKRHKLLLSASAVALVLKSTMGGKGAKELGFEVMSDLRRKEIEKWGSRAGRA